MKRLEEIMKGVRVTKTNFNPLFSLMSNQSELDYQKQINIRMIDMLKGNELPLSNKDELRLLKMNLSSDLETLMLVENILKNKYHVDTQQEGILS